MLSDSKCLHGGDLKNMFPSEQQQTELKKMVRNDLLVFRLNQNIFSKYFIYAAEARNCMERHKGDQKKYFLGQYLFKACEAEN